MRTEPGWLKAVSSSIGPDVGARWRLADGGDVVAEVRAVRGVDAVAISGLVIVGDVGVVRAAVRER